jgi:Mg2+ and Co2+ transporter CorA
MGLIIIQPTAPMPLFGVVSNKAGGHVVSTILVAMVGMLLTAISYGRMARLVRFLPDTAAGLFADIADQFGVVTTMADGQREFLHGVIEFYQTRTSTHMTMAAEKAASTGIQQNEDMRRITAWVAIVAVPTAVTGFFGQNVPYPGFGTDAGFIASVLIMIVLAAVLYIVFKRKDWL